jgi:uncharacterized membrane protein
MAENDELDDLEEQDDNEQDDGDDGGDEPQGSADGGLVEGLMSRLGENGRSALKPVASAAAVAAATYVAKNGPQLLKDFGSDKTKEKLGQAHEKGGVTGFAAGAAKRALSGSGGNLVERLKHGGEAEAKKQASESGGALGLVGKAAEKLSGSGAGGKGWGKGRRLPIMQSIDVAAPLETVYNQWTQFEEHNAYMHRVQGVEQRDDNKVVWRENIWGRRREWNAKITEQTPNERIAWESDTGNGVITFHKLAPKLTRVEVVFDWQPSGLVEKLASGMRFHKRAAKSDLRRFKAFVETRGEETGGWRGKIEDGQVKGEARNRRKRGADDIPDEARQHSEDDNQPSNGSGDDNDERERAREERAQHRKERASSR